MNKPKINLIYYKNILDGCVVRFMDEHNSDFTKGEDGRYVFSGGISESELKRIFLSYVKDEISKYVKEYKESSPEFLFVIGSCYPGDNKLLSFGGKAPKLRKLIEIIPDITYFLKEQDIELDMRMVNSVFYSIFSKFMKEKRKTWKNVFFIKHRKIDCYMIYRFFKRKFGKMVVNLHKKMNLGEDRAIFTINEKIDKICPFKDDYIERGFFKDEENEVYQYIDTCLSGDM